MRVGGTEALYLCIGQNMESGHITMGLSSEQASIVYIKESLTRRLPQSGLDITAMVATLSNMLCAMEIIDTSRARDLILVNPDQSLVHCLKSLMPLAQEHLDGQIHLCFWTTDETLAKKNNDFKFMHAWSSSRDVKQALPENSTVRAFLSEATQLWKTLATICPEITFGYGCSGINGSTKHKLNCFDKKLGRRTADVLDHAVTMSLQMVQSEGAQPPTRTFMTPAKLLDSDNTIEALPFTIVDWKTDRWVTVTINPHSKPKALQDDRTYMLVGLTRDFGQSLCRLFVEQGARHILIASRNPDPRAVWVAELNQQGANILVMTLDVASLEAVKLFKSTIQGLDLPPLGGIVNGAMVLEDRVFMNMGIDSWDRAMRPKLTGSQNLDIVFAYEELDLFIMTSSFAAIGGHAGQATLQQTCS